MRISVELVPRSVESLLEQLEQVTNYCPSADTINIPDVLRFELRSWQGCARAKDLFEHAIPHLRAMDVDLKAPLALGPFLRAHDIHEVLVVTGDAPVDMSHKVYGSSAIDLIKKLRVELPEVKIYAALDPYRQSFLAERDYALKKLEAGASGLFTQPFFDVRLMEVYADLLPGIEVFWGVTSVTSRRSARYWQTRNKVFFPRSNRPSPGTAPWRERPSTSSGSGMQISTSCPFAQT
jgi:methylenetetrahydrofolate reductase (NADPH)